MQRFKADDARSLTKKNGKKILIVSGAPNEDVKQGIIAAISEKAAGGGNRIHFYLDPDGAPGSHLYFYPEDESALDQLRHIDEKRGWIVRAMFEAGYKTIVSKGIVCRNCTGLPSNPCDECSGKKPVGISFKRQDWIEYSYIEVRW